MDVDAILDDAVVEGRGTGLGTMLSPIRRDFGGVDIDVERDPTSADPARFR